MKVAVAQIRIWTVLATLVVTSGTAVADASPDARPLQLAQSHAFSRAEARLRVQQLLDYWSQRFGVQRSWQGDTARVRGSVMGVPFDGQVVVSDHEVSASTSDPGRFLRSTALDYVQRKLKKYLHPTYQEG